MIRDNLQSGFNQFNESTPTSGDRLTHTVTVGAAHETEFLAGRYGCSGEKFAARHPCGLG
jgi:hypothetical protein